jgi:hypothetical protein
LVCRGIVEPAFDCSGGSRRFTLGADKTYDVHEFVDDLRELNVMPHTAQDTTNCTSAIDARTARHPGLCDQLTETYADRGAVRLGQDHCGVCPPHAARGLRA